MARIELACQAHSASPDFSKLDEQLGDVKFSLSDHMLARVGTFDMDVKAKGV